MKAPRTIFYIFVTAIVLFLIFVLFEHQKQTEKSEPQTESIETNSNPPTSPKTSQMPEVANIHVISDITTSSNRIIVAEKDGLQKTAYVPLGMPLTDDQILYGLFYTNPPPKPSTQKLNQHLTFYGMAVDDQTNVVTGAIVAGSVLVMDSKNPGRQVPVETTSDSAGRFQFDVDFGQEIMISVSNGTNYISPQTQWFRYPPGWYGPTDSPLISHPDINDPVTFVLTKKQNPEPLIEIRKGMVAPNTGEPVRIDLTTGQVVPTGGDLIVSITCLEPYKAGVHIPWKLVLQATDGGFITKSSEMNNYVFAEMLEAPISGYEEIVIDHPADDPDWKSQYGGTLYIKSRGGQIYGKLSFDTGVRWDERGVPFGFHSFVNTNGSRNLQGISQ